VDIVGEILNFTFALDAKQDAYAGDVLADGE
jgi:hypothetical protein